MRPNSSWWLPDIGSLDKDTSTSTRLLNTSAKRSWSFLSDIQKLWRYYANCIQCFSDLRLKVLPCSNEQVPPVIRTRSSMLTAHENSRSRSLFPCPMIHFEPLLAHQYLKFKQSRTFRSYTLILYNGFQWVYVPVVLPCISLDVSKNKLSPNDTMKTHWKDRFKVLTVLSDGCTCQLRVELLLKCFLIAYALKRYFMARNSSVFKTIFHDCQCYWPIFQVIRIAYNFCSVKLHFLFIALPWQV